MSARALLFSALALCAAPAAAQSTCSAGEQFRLDWNQQTQGQQGTAPRSYTAQDGLGHTETVTVSYDGATGAFKPVNVGTGTVTPPFIGVANTGGLATSEATLTLGVTFDGFSTNIDSGVNVVGVRFVASKPLREIAFSIFDIDYVSGSYRDWIKITGQTAAGLTVVPRISTPYGNNNQTKPGRTAPGVASVGAARVSGYTPTSSETVGVASSGNGDAFGNITAAFSEPVVRIDIRYGNGPASTMSGTPGFQFISIHDLLFCTMPEIALAKTSAAAATSGPDRFNAPGSDVDYTLTLTNTGGSAVDVNTARIADLLPAGLSFFNGDLDPATPGVQPFVFTAGTSGLTLAAGDVGYSNNAGASYAYTPASGYDPAVNAVRFQPQGTMAAYSTAIIRFRARIN